MDKLMHLILIAVALALGIGTLVLNLLKGIDVNTSIILLSISVVCLAIVKLKQK
ncbi:MAG TPA: hypothetical protein VFF20_02830 [Pseudogracilibacillus sp.]|nr:hypothetical protein [Pseudogracilibacillus sp.]